MLKLNWKMNKEKWLFLLFCGVIMLILSLPSPGKSGGGTAVPGGNPGAEAAQKTGGTAKAQAAGDEEREYELFMETRVKEILKNVEGVGKVDVMITLKTSKEKVLRIDKDKSRSSTEEKDSAGGTRSSMSEEIKESTLLSGGTASGEPVVQKEIQPEIEGIVICAQGGGSALVKTEISQAMEALFNIPAHKIKVLKRVE